MKQKLKNIKLAFLIIFIFLNMNNLFAQDLNQTNTRYFPLYLNPALTGHFQGNYRIGGTFRDQGKEFMHQGYKTINLYLDSPISISFGKYSWIGAGIQLYKDVAGELPFTTTGAIVNFAYHFAFDKKYKNVFSIGIQYGNLIRKIDDTKIRLESDYINSGVQNDRIRFANFKKQFSDINIGILYRKKFNKNNFFDLGFSVYHLPKPGKNILLVNQPDLRFTFHSGLRYLITERFIIKPRIIMSFSKNAYNIMPQIKTFFDLNKKKKNDNMIYAGLGYRINDAILLMFGMRYKKLDVGIAYDITVSSAAQYNNNHGGLEIGIFKIINISKKPEINPVLHCPEL